MRLLLIASFLASCSGSSKPDRAHHDPPPANAGVALPLAAPAAATTPAKQAAPSWLGVRFDQQTTKVIQVVSGTPADKGGLRVGDELATVDGKRVTTGPEAIAAIRAHPAGTTPIGVVRDGKQVTVNVPLAPMPDSDDIPRVTLVGKPAPAFTAQKIQGEHTPSLADLKGQVVVVDFWATWCGPCEDSMPVLDQWQAKYGAKGLRIVGVSSEDEKDIRKFLADHPVSYTIARDANDSMGRQYLRQSLPMLVVIDRTGVVRHVHIGAGHFEEVEAAINRLL